MSVVPDDWTPRLTQAVAATIREYHNRGLKDCPVVAFDLSCYPWHGSIELSFLTAAEMDADELLVERSEIAAWTHYDFASESEPWQPAGELGQQMSELYYATEDEDDAGRVAVVESFLRACADAVGSPEVTAALNELTRDPRFRIFVRQPDSGQEFWPPTQVE